MQLFINLLADQRNKVHDNGMDTVIKELLGYSNLIDENINNFR